MSSRSRKPQKYRGPSRPIDPRYAPGLPQRKGPDTFGMVLIGVSTAAVLLVIIYIALFQQPTTTTTTGLGGQPVSGAEATQQVIAYSTQVATLPRIEAAEAKALHEAGTATIIDVRPTAGYAAEHIAGSTNIPYTDVQARVAEFPKEGNIILYCQWPADEESVGSAQYLISQGYTNVRVLRGGLDAWKNAGGPTEK